MQIVRDLTKFHIADASAVAIGKFDGIHKGHRLLLSKIKEAKKQGLYSVVFTFNPPPSVYFGWEQKQLTTLDEKEAIFEQAGVDYLVEYPFHKASADMLPEVFVKEILVDALHAKLVVSGEDVSFGRQGMGDAALLSKLAEQYAFEVCFVRKICLFGNEISSSLIRNTVEQGAMEYAAEMLGDAFSITGTVEHGNHIGRTIGFPTMNVKPDVGKLLPPNGVYFTRTLCDGISYQGITNLGQKPTIGAGNDVVAETFLYGFVGDAYGKQITVSFLHFVRPERKFDSFEQLKAAIDADVQKGKAYFAFEESHL